jgi:uncharacterized protein YcnI
MSARKLIAGVAAGGVALVALTAPALAHVSVNPGAATQGGFTKLAFSVPNEEAAVNTTKLDVQLPADHPLASVSVKPHAGWTADVKKTTLATPITSDDGPVTEAVTEITWTATGEGIKPGEFDEFEISVGPLPTDVDSLTFKAVQTYSDGTEVAWIEVPDASGKEPDHPAPVLTLTAAGTGDDTHSHDSSSSSDGTAAPATPSATKSDDSNALAVVALVVAAVGIALAAAALVKARGRSGDGESSASAA